MYTGWIPNASGYLSFSHIGGMKIRHRTVFEDIHPPTKFQENARYLSLLQERNLSDKPPVGFLNSNPRRGRFTFLLQAELVHTSGTRQLLGTVFCVPASLAEPLRLLHDRARHQAPSSFAAWTASTIGALQYLGQAFFAISFSLDDDGVVTVVSLANAAPTDQGGILRAFEAYSFIKDVLHRHRFHSPTDDALLELTPDDPSMPNLWADRVAKNLHRSVISSFRNTSPSAQVDGLGKLAYLESFTAVLGRRGIPPPPVSMTSLRSAIDANQARGLLEREEKSLLLTYMLSLAAIVLPILFVCLQLLQMPCIERLTFNADQCKVRFQVPDMMIYIATITLGNLPWVILTASFLAAGMVLLLGKKKLHAYISGKMALASWTTDLRDLLFRVAVSSRPLALTLLLVFSAGVLTAAWWLIEKLIGPWSFGWPTI